MTKQFTITFVGCTSDDVDHTGQKTSHDDAFTNVDVVGRLIGYGGFGEQADHRTLATIQDENFGALARIESEVE